MDSSEPSDAGKANARGGYPLRAPFHAQRVIRAMTKTAAAQEIGTAGFALVALVACQEDAKRYAAPPHVLQSSADAAAWRLEVGNIRQGSR